MSDSLSGLLNEFEAMIHRAQRNHDLFSGIAWEAHLETLSESALPDLLAQRELVETNMQIFANEPDEVDRLQDCLEMVSREIAYLRSKKPKKGKQL